MKSGVFVCRLDPIFGHQFYRGFWTRAKRQFIFPADVQYFLQILAQKSFFSAVLGNCIQEET